MSRERTHQNTPLSKLFKSQHFLPRPNPNRAGAAVPHPSTNTTISKTLSPIYQEALAPPKSRAGGRSSSRRGSVRISRGIPSPKTPVICTWLSNSCSRTLAHGLRDSARNPVVCLIFFPHHRCPGQSPGHRNVPDCVSWKQAGQDARGFGPNYKINVKSPNGPKVNLCF